MEQQDQFVIPKHWRRQPVAVRWRSGFVHGFCVGINLSALIAWVIVTVLR